MMLQLKTALSANKNKVQVSENAIEPLCTSDHLLLIICFCSESYLNGIKTNNLNNFLFM